jgi:hypothetical protein
MGLSSTGARQPWLKSFGEPSLQVTIEGNITGRRGERNSYLPKDGILSLISLKPFSHE